jgi:squalene-hopene/tetraprenyl-beta-curcumene cyclase
MAADGAEPGWRLGRDLGSYDDREPAKGVGPSTASQTAWAVMGLLAANDTRSESRGARNCLSAAHAEKDGSWDEPRSSRARLSARVLSEVLHLYRQYFPLIALTAYAKVMAEKSSN